MECKHFTSQRAADQERRKEGGGRGKDGRKSGVKRWGSLGKRLLSGPIKPQFTPAPPRGSLVIESLSEQKLTPIKGFEGRVFNPTSARRSRVSSRYGDGPAGEQLGAVCGQ